MCLVAVDVPFGFLRLGNHEITRQRGSREQTRELWHRLHKAWMKNDWIFSNDLTFRRTVPLSFLYPSPPANVNSLLNERERDTVRERKRESESEKVREKEMEK